MSTVISIPIHAAVGDAPAADRGRADVFGSGRNAVDFAGGAVHARLGLDLWMAGRWDVAALCFRLACEMSPALDPAAAAVAPLLPISLGDFREADRQLKAAGAHLDETPQAEAIQLLLITRVVRLHADGSDQQRAGLLVELRSQHGEVLAQIAALNAIAALHYAMAAIWAHDHDLACTLIDRLALWLDLDWAAGAAAWLRGLLAESDGDVPSALEQLEGAMLDPMSSLPLYEAHRRVDHARIAGKLGAAARAEQSLSFARQGYERIGATGYLHQIEMQARRKAPQDNTVSLSSRERDVLELTVSGLTYAQIARDLFISISTVGFHLSNIYAKTGVTSRHQLTDEARRDPASIGLAA